MAEPFERTIYARWGDMDFNGHMRNTAFLDAAADVRMMFFAAHGFTMRDFERLKIGPVILHDELDYFRELRLLEKAHVTLAVAGESADGSHFLLVNEFRREDGPRAARVASRGGWLDLQARRFTVPPRELRDAMSAMARDAAFAELTTLVRPSS